MTAENAKLQVGLARFSAPWFDRIGYGGLHEGTPDHTAPLCAYLRKHYALIDAGTAKTSSQGVDAATKLRAAAVDIALVVLPAWSDDESVVAFLSAVAPTPVWFVDIGSYLDIPTRVSDQAVFFAHTELVGLLQATATAKRATCRTHTFRWRAELQPSECSLAHALVALDAARSISSAVIGVLPSRATEIRCASVDELALAQTTRCCISYISVAELSEAFKRVEDATVIEYVRCLKARTRHRRGGTPTAFRDSARLACALASLAVTRSLAALAFDDSSSELHKTFHLRPCLIARELLPRCPPIALEGDIGAAVTMLIMERMGCAASAIVEPFFCDQRRSAVLFGHAGGCDPRLGKPGSTVIEPDLEYLRSEDRHKGSPSLMVTGRPGTVTLAALQVNSRAKGIVLLRGEAITHNRVLPGYSEFLVRFPTHPQAVIDFMLANSCSQHFTIAYGDFAQQMKVFAEAAALTYVEM